MPGLGRRPGGTAHGSGAGGVGYAGDSPGAGVGVGKGRAGPDCLRAEQYGRGDGAGGSGDRGVNGDPPHQPRAEAGMAQRRHTGGTSSGRRAPGNREPASGAGVRYGGDCSGDVCRTGGIGSCPGEAAGRAELLRPVGGPYRSWAPRDHLLGSRTSGWWSRRGWG